MESQIFISKDGHFYRAEKTFLKVRFLRVGDDYVHPNPRALRPATQAEIKIMGLGLSSHEIDVPCVSEMRQQAELEEDETEEDALKVGTLESPSDHYDWDRLILYPEAVQSIQMAVNYIENRAQMEQVFNVSSLDPSTKQLINFYGPPGTGKTMAAKAVARQIGKPLLQADYSQIVSKWVGETSKGIKLLFEEAKRLDAVLFLDEADALTSRRLENPTDSAGMHFNQEKTVFMQELDKFQGIVIMTTNLFQNYDDALLRRIAEHVRFDMPDMSMREKILRQFFGKTVNVTVNYSNLAHATEGFSGGDLLNVAKNSIKLAALSGKDATKWRVDDQIASTVIRQILESKQASGSYVVKRKLGLTA